MFKSLFTFSLLWSLASFSQTPQSLMVFNFEGQPKTALKEMQEMLGAHYSITDINPVISPRVVTMEIEGKSREQARKQVLEKIEAWGNCDVYEEAEDRKVCLNPTNRSLNAFNFGDWFETAKKQQEMLIAGSGLSGRILLPTMNLPEVQAVVDYINGKANSHYRIHYIVIKK